MHAWKPGTVTCFYPIYYPDFSAFCSIQPLYYKLPSGKLLDQITKSFCLLSPANDIYFYFETLPTARSVGRKALGVGITRHILESAAGTEMWRPLIWKLQWQFLSVPKNKRWGGKSFNRTEEMLWRTQTWPLGKARFRSSQQERSCQLGSTSNESPNYWSYKVWWRRRISWHYSVRWMMRAHLP